MKKLLIATNNKGKVKELRELLKDTGLELITPADINLILEVEEDGQTYSENAARKAIAFTHASGFISLADDSGLEVDALDGAPGLHSARYGPSLTLPPFSEKMGGDGGGWKDADRRAYLLENLKDKPRPWTARFHATIAISVSGENVYIAEGNCYGEIIPDERGTSGFGYDPVFYFPEFKKTMAEMDMEEKNRLSHRAVAVINATPILKKIFEL